MISIEDIEVVSNNTLAYVEGNVCYQYDCVEELKKGQKGDAKNQFALILSISNRSRESIEKHMRINGYNGFAKCYSIA